VLRFETAMQVALSISRPEKKEVTSARP